MAAANQLWNAADDQLAALKNGGPLEGNPPQAINRPPTLAPVGTPYGFSTLIAEWARERKAQDKTKYGFEKIITKLSKHLGHDDAAAVTDTDLISWKESLIQSDLSPKTIKNHLLVVKTLFKFAKANKKIAANVAAEVSYQARTDPREKRLGYSDEDARRILIAARGETEPHLRWVPWLACFTGARLEELVGAMVRDLETIDGIPCLHIRLDLPPETSITEK
jgi:site-specific recombinase XerD